MKQQLSPLLHDDDADQPLARSIGSAALTAHLIPYRNLTLVLLLLLLLLLRTLLPYLKVLTLAHNYEYLGISFIGLGQPAVCHSISDQRDRVTPQTLLDATGPKAVRCLLLRQKR